jgi:hypothetical protein
MDDIESFTSGFGSFVALGTFLVISDSETLPSTMDR